MTKKIFPLAWAVFLITASFGFAQSPGADSPLTWTDCVSIALRNNPDLASSRSSRDANQASYRGSFNGLMPQVTLSNSYSDAKGAGNPSWQTRGGVSLDIFNVSQISNIRASKASLSQAEASLRSNSSLLRFNLRKAFAQVYFAWKNVEVSRSIKEMRQTESQLVALRYSSGRESKGNMLRAKAQAFQAEASLLQAQRDMKTAQRTLQRQLGVTELPSVVQSTFSIEAPSDLPGDVETLIADLPEIALRESAVRSAEANLSRSKSSLWPSLSANYSRSVSGPSEFPSEQTGWNLGAVLSYPLFGGGPTATYFEIAAAGKNMEKAEQDLRSAREQALVDIETAWSEFAGAVDQAKVQALLLEAARQRNDEADIRYDSGLMTYDNWEIIVSDRVNQERQAIQAQQNAVVSEAAWMKSLGKSLEE